jgi:hypothetical protein
MSSETPWRQLAKVGDADGEEHVLAALGGVRVFAEQAQHERDGGADRGAARFEGMRA